MRHESAKNAFLTGTPEAEAQAIKDSADAELAAAAQEVLGAELHERFQLYERQRQAWEYVADFGCKLSLVDMPLSLEQASRLVDALANANASFQKGGPVAMNPIVDAWRSPVAGMSLPAVDWNAVDAAAAEFLTPEQMHFFKNVCVPEHIVAYSRQKMELHNALQNLPAK